MEPVPAVAAMVMTPGVEVLMVMLEPWTKVETPQVPEPEAESSCPAWVGEEEVPVPPLAIES